MDATVNIDATKPLLIYDGDCDFCRYWVDYWRKLTGDAVAYQPYQKVAAQFPQIPLPEFQRAVQYVAPDGTIARAARASLLTLSHAPGHGRGLWLYQKLPGFAKVSEGCYRFIAARRGMFYQISRRLWGDQRVPATYDLLAWFFLRLLGGILAAAFISCATQALGLIGSQGIVPVTNFLAAVSAQVGVSKYWLLPNVFWFAASDNVIQWVCWGGAGLSFLLVFNIWPRLCLLFTYLLYLSLTYAGQVFMTFQWDLFLLETTFVALFLVGNTRPLGVLLMRWLQFRFIFAAGLVKLYSFDPTWRHLTALNYYFNTAPLPTPLAWYAHHLPRMVLQFCTFAALFIEIVLPFLFFLPRKIRFLAAYAILLMQIIITLTGNYNFFNFLTMLLCLTLFDDQALRAVLPRRFSAWLSPRVRQPQPTQLTAGIATGLGVCLIIISLLQFHERFSGPLNYPLNLAAHALEPLHISNSYGPFAMMTTERMEIILEGSAEGVYWTEYDFKYKPGDIYRRPPWNIPHQPRLDWQMWFAALGSAQQNPWLLGLLHGLLTNAPPVTALLAHNPFADKPPLFIRAAFYRYRFTTPAERAKTGAWWEREYVQEYIPAVHLVY